MLVSRTRGDDRVFSSNRIQSLDCSRILRIMSDSSCDGAVSKTSSWLNDDSKGWAPEDIPVFGREIWRILFGDADIAIR